MSQDRSHRISNAIDSLITHLVPGDERHDHCFELVRSILESPPPAISSDVNHASDLIKRKLIQSDPSQALRFSNLYTRLLSLPVLNQKWAILYLLYQLSDSPDPASPRRASEDKVPPSTPASPSHEPFRDAFAPDGLKRFPQQPQPQQPQDQHQQHEAQQQQQQDQDQDQGQEQGQEQDPPQDPPSSALLRDLPFTLQGLSSTTLPFGESCLRLPPTLPTPLVSLLHTLAEPSLLYRRLAAFVRSPAGGLLGQSLRSAVDAELRSYLALVATLEGQIRRALADCESSFSRVSLKRCVVWTREATMGLRLMSLIADESESRRGGQLVSLIHGFSTSHGDPTVAAFAERLLARVSRPFYDMLRRWIYDGELSDPYLEFFVHEQRGNDDERREQKAKGLMSVWNSKYDVDPAMVPSIITADFARKVFLIGKSLNFIRHSCADSQWVEAYSKTSSKELRYGDTATLEAWIDEAYKTTMQRLMGLMASKFRLFEHLQALKDYILLGQGDFIALLMESLAANLDRPAGAQYRHTLTAQLEHAIRGSNAQFDSPDVLRRLDARMLQLSHGDIGWDCFTLEYKVDAPVDVVVTEWGNRQYLKVFNFLWRVKRVEFALASAWRKCMTGARGVLQTDDPRVLHSWKRTRGVLAEMVHFVGQLQYYVLFEVIESSWSELQASIHKDDCTLDDLIHAHDKYLKNITHKGLLGARRRQHQHETASTLAAEIEDRNSYMVQLGGLLRDMLAYRDAVDGLYSWSVSDFTRRQEADAAERLWGKAPPTSSRRPSTSGGPDDDPEKSSLPTSEFPALQDRLRQLGASFRTRLQILLGDLAYQPDVDMRFLGVAMNFNDVYQPVRRKSRAAGQAAQ